MASSHTARSELGWLHCTRSPLLQKQRTTENSCYFPTGIPEHLGIKWVFLNCTVRTFDFKNCCLWGWRNGSVVKSTYCSLKNPVQFPELHVQQLTTIWTPALDDLMLLIYVGTSHDLTLLTWWGKILGCFFCLFKVCLVETPRYVSRHCGVPCLGWWLNITPD